MIRISGFVILVFAVVGCAAPAPKGTTAPIVLPPPPVVYFHLPGIAGTMPSDRVMTKALVASGVVPAAEIVDWTQPTPGVAALGNVVRNKEQAQRLAGRITALVRADPRTIVILSGHSGGAGIAVWTLEALPPDVRVDQLLLLSGALSPGYDLTKALAHVRTHAYSFYSPRDGIVLSTLTSTFGTIDRVKSQACGFTPFIPPAGANYSKLRQFGYDPAWEILDNDGQHMASLSRRFARGILAPLLTTGVLPAHPVVVP